MTAQAPDWRAATVVVAGDVMLDRYWRGTTPRVSPEAPVPVVQVAEVSDRPGGAGNVASNLAAVGVSVSLVGVTGDDAEADVLQARLAEAGVRCRMQRAPAHPTTTKLRVMSRSQQLIRLDFEDTAAPVDDERLRADCAELLRDADALVLSDYGKGCLRDPRALIRAARQAGVPAVVDPRSRDFEDYRGAAVVTPNLAELADVLGSWADEAELTERCARLCRDLEIGALVVTRGEEGMTTVTAEGRVADLRAETREVYDVTGAGDTVVALLAGALASGVPLSEAARLANLGAGVVVGKPGAATVAPRELALAGREAEPGQAGAVDEDSLVRLVAAARERGERIVFTNGCFDVLHPGHVACLREAAALGDRLVVAVNDDDSVTRLKGEGRPVNPLEHRMAVLAGQAGVDWVVAFGEDTPERLIERLAPDVLAKGGDYRPDQIVGAETVRAAGGEVRALGWLGDYSTTAIVERLRGGARSR